MKFIAVIFAALFLTACMPNYSDGSRVGVVTKFSHKGIVFKSWEGELNMGGLRNETDEHGNSSVVANVFEFNVSDPAVVTQVQDAMKSGKRVELVYSQWLMHPWNIDSQYVITSVK